MSPFISLGNPLKRLSVRACILDENPDETEQHLGWFEPAHWDVCSTLCAPVTTIFFLAAFIYPCDLLHEWPTEQAFFIHDSFVLLLVLDFFKQNKRALVTKVRQMLSTFPKDSFMKVKTWSEKQKETVGMLPKLIGKFSTVVRKLDMTTGEKFTGLSRQMCVRTKPNLN